jgi:hypothetical protein
VVDMVVGALMVLPILKVKINLDVVLQLLQNLIFYLRDMLLEHMVSRTLVVEEVDQEDLNVVVVEVEMVLL